jgi:CheY-like chemotaxis protein/DNA-directed RNA polymerase specialized sigma24 family protein
MSALRREDLILALPYARRYARALTGSQNSGDSLVAESLRDLLAGPKAASAEARNALYAAVTRRFDSQEQVAQPSNDGLTRKQRQLLLLTSLEEVPIDYTAAIVGMDTSRAVAELAVARDRLKEAAATDVLIIEDEPIIAMDIEELVRGCGHRIVGVASTEADAVDIATRTRPGLILADINLGAGGDGSLAVARILRLHQTPVIFVTAYPERLLTGAATEPAFVITKPFEPMTLAIATYQAVTGGVVID